jgi:trimethylamine---corrinoid protein Co-methyltransferase
LPELYREGVLVKPYERLDENELLSLDRASMEILSDPGVFSFNERATKLFQSHGADVSEEKRFNQPCWRVRLPAGLVREAVSKAPSTIILGARKPENRLKLEARVPRAYFGSGSESNVWLESSMEEYVHVNDNSDKIKYPRHREKRGTAELLARAARLCDRLEHLDFFIRPLNIQDPEITVENHDVNKFFASLNNITKHVEAGLTNLGSLGDVIKMAEIIAGGAEELRKNPVISFITCLFKSPLQIVDDTAEKVFAIVEAGLPLVMSSSPQGGSTAPIQEAGMVAQINAEILAGIALTQLIKEGAPVLYGSVPVRARMDDLHDLYGCPEFNQYNVDCVQLARFYNIPCYSTAGVGDAKVPGVQAVFEKLFTHLYMAMSGAQYIHYAFGLLDRTNTFSPLQAVLDNEQIGKVKHCLAQPLLNSDDIESSLKMVRKVIGSKTWLYARQARKAIHTGYVSDPYMFEGKDGHDRVIENALEHLAHLESLPPQYLEQGAIDRIYQEVPGILPSLRPKN